MNYLASGFDQVRIRDYIHHPYYDPESSMFPNDISILKLVRPLIFGSYIRQACLPEPSLAFDPKLKFAFLSGWGQTNLFFQPIGTIKLPITLQYVSIPLVSYKDCVSKYPGSKIAFGMFCAGRERPEQGPCTGDSGKFYILILTRKYEFV